VIPPIFASSLLLMPLTIAQFAGQPWRAKRLGASAISSPVLSTARRSTCALRAGIIFFCSSTPRCVHPEETADNLKRYGGFIPGIPGKNTEEYLDTC
jgi:preprotein translocase subunit SecY